MQYLGNKLRHEQKYYINQREYLLLKNSLKHLMKRDEFSDKDGCYHVRSLYFDDVYDTSLYEKNYGVFSRQKYRIRIYNRSDNVIKLECKSKYGEFISKESKNISKDNYHALMNNDISFMEKEFGLLNKFYTRNACTRLNPKVIVDYEREAYVIPAGDVRITFDKDLQAGFNTNDIFDNNVSTVNVLENSLIVLEIKYNDFIPAYLQSILNLSSHTRCAISKYVMCRVLKNNIF